VGVLLLLLLPALHSQGVVSRRETDLFSFSLPQATNNTRPYRLLLLLRTVDGDAQL
jgi:hypothetical protein